MQKTEVFPNYIAFLEREDKLSNGVSVGFSENNLNYQKENEGNEGCFPQIQRKRHSTIYLRDLKTRYNFGIFLFFA